VGIFRGSGEYLGGEQIVWVSHRAAVGVSEGFGPFCLPTGDFLGGEYICSPVLVFHRAAVGIFRDSGKYLGGESICLPVLVSHKAAVGIFRGFGGYLGGVFASKGLDVES